MLNMKKLLTKVLDAVKTDYIVEQGTSGNWNYRKWQSGKVEAWYYKQITVAVTTQSPAYGGYRSADIPVTIPSGIFNSTPDFALGAKNSPNSVRLMNVSITSKTQINFYCSSAESITNDMYFSFYVLKQ